MQVKTVQHDPLLGTNEIKKILLANFDICVAKVSKGRIQMRAFSRPCMLRAAASSRVVTKPWTAQTKLPSPSRPIARTARAADAKSEWEILII